MRAVLIACAALFTATGVVPLAKYLTDGRAVAWWDLAVREWLMRGGIVVALAVATTLLLRERLDFIVERAKGLILEPTARQFAIATSVAAGVLALAFTWYSFSGVPFTSDEMAQQWHARILLNGRFAAAAEAHPEFFNTAPVFDREGRWFSQYPVGGPAVIAIGLAIGMAWLVNPVLIGIACWQLLGFMRRAFGESVGRLTTLLFALSPMVLIMGGSQMSHVPALTLALVALNALAKWDTGEGNRIAAGITIGLGIGAMATVRPLDAALVAAVIGGFQLWRAFGDRSRWRSLVAQVVAGAIPVAFLLWANQRTTGSAFVFGYEALNGPEHAIGFHVDPNGELHTPRRGLAYLSGYLMRLSRYLLEWPIPGMLFVVAGLVAIRKPGRWHMLMVALATSFLFAYAAYWFDGFFSGPRFLFTAVPAFLLFIASGIVAAMRAPDIRIRRAMAVLVPLCILTAWLGPSGISNIPSTANLYREQRTKLKTDFSGQVERAGLRNAVVFVNEGWRGRLLARLRVLGASAFRAERIVNAYDACALGGALDDADRMRNLPGSERLELVVRRAASAGQARPVPELPADRAISIVPGSTPTPECLAEYGQDLAGTMPYPPFLPLHMLDSDGHIAGNVIFARDLGARNELLRGRFPQRRWYRYRPGRSADDTANVFVPYEVSGR